jgi:hypothetical protein
MTTLLTRRRFTAGLAAAPLAAATLVAAEKHPFEQGKGELLYWSAMSSEASLEGWTMEGPGRVVCKDGWMEMWSPGERMHHVYWCPETFPASFAAEWECQNLHLEAGLCIVFFCAAGLEGQDVLDPTLLPRDGTFSQYNNGALKNYHISYYANTPSVPDRPVARLRKNPGHTIVAEGPPGIVTSSSEIHHVRLLKTGARIQLWADERSIIDWSDDGTTLGAPYGAGKIALRQMQWTQFRYRNFRVWGVRDSG